MVETITAESMMKALGLIPHPEGGFFLETHRSGSAPMSSNGQTDLNVPSKDLVSTNRTDRRLDNDGRRNVLTSIYWMPTGSSPVLDLGINLSDHIHYYHGGVPFEYILFNPQTGELQRVVLGSNVLAGHKFQVPVKGGTWKCGHLLLPDSSEASNSYCLIGEAVAPGFDFHDFSWVTAEMINKIAPHVSEVLKPFLHNKTEESYDSSSVNNKDEFVFNNEAEWTSYYHNVKTKL